MGILRLNCAMNAVINALIFLQDIKHLRYTFYAIMSLKSDHAIAISENRTNKSI